MFPPLGQNFSDPMLANLAALRNFGGGGFGANPPGRIPPPGPPMTGPYPVRPIGPAAPVSPMPVPVNGTPAYPVQPIPQPGPQPGPQTWGANPPQRILPPGVEPTPVTGTPAYPVSPMPVGAGGPAQPVGATPDMTSPNMPNLQQLLALRQMMMQRSMQPQY